jgi:SAM-dependent methyltransferase
MNEHQDLWKALYVDRISPEQTKLECDFIEHFMPLASFPRLLDLACETGRHTLELATRGYSVTGADINVKALHVAEAHAAERKLEASFIAADIRELQHLDGEFDGIILFWQSFGFFDSTVQVGLFFQLHRLLRSGGRLIFDLYNALFFTRDMADNTTTPDDMDFVPRSWASGQEIMPRIGYEDDLLFEERRRADLFDPHLFTPGEIAGIAANNGLHLIASCSDYSPTIPATREREKMQLVFERE